ncbi:hypothetical protein V1478_002897, partial [Vespula squamosa]
METEGLGSLYGFNNRYPSCGRRYLSPLDEDPRTISPQDSNEFQEFRLKFLEKRVTLHSCSRETFENARVIGGKALKYLLELTDLVVSYELHSRLSSAVSKFLQGRDRSINS